MTNPIDKYTQIDDLLKSMKVIEEKQLAIEQQNQENLASIADQLSYITGKPLEISIDDNKFSNLYNQKSYKATPFFYHNLERDLWYKTAKTVYWEGSYTAITNYTSHTYVEAIADYTIPALLTALGVTEKYEVVHFSEITVKGTTVGVLSNQNFRLLKTTTSAGISGMSSFLMYTEPISYNLDDWNYYYTNQDSVRIGLGYCFIGNIVEYSIKLKLYKDITESQAKDYLKKTF